MGHGCLFGGSARSDEDVRSSCSDFWAAYQACMTWLMSPWQDKAVFGDG